MSKGAPFFTGVLVGLALAAGVIVLALWLAINYDL